MSDSNGAANNSGSKAADDWYADFNPDDFKDYKQDNNGYTSRGGGGGSSGGGGYDSYNSGGGGRGGASRSGGSGSGYHDYQRDTSRDSSNVDEAAVNSLLADRLQAKKTRDFSTADEIRDELLSAHGVSVWDKDKTWKTGSSAGGSGMSRGGGGRDGAGRGRDGGGRERGGRDGGGRGGGRPQRDFGPNGHDYFMSDDAGPVQSDFSEAQINELLAERLQCKMSRDFRNADRIQEDLIGAGVYVNDAMKEWRADGTMFGDLGNGGRPGRERGSRSDRNRDYAMSEYSSAENPLSPQEAAEIQAMVSDRANAKMSRDYRTADDIREELRSNWNVLIDDRARQWSVGGDFGPDHSPATNQDQPYKQSSYSMPIESEEILAKIMQAVEERGQAKKDRNYAVADAIRDDLETNYNCNVNDRAREWSVGGDFGDEQANSAHNGRKQGWTRRGGGDISEAETAVVSSMLEERIQAKKERDFNTADQIRDDLYLNFSVKVDDKSQEWRVMSDTYVLSPLNNGQLNFDAETMTYVEGKLAERNDAKARKDYDTADDIRDELRNKYAVTIDDRTREWSVESSGGDYGYQAAQQQRPETSLETSSEEAEFFESLAEDMDEDVNGTDEDASGDSSDLSSLTVVDLKEKLKAAGLPVSGKKAELIERLEASA